MAYTVHLKKAGEIEEFEKQRENVLLIAVQDINGNYLNKNCVVKISMSKNAMLGFGKGLIRSAYKKIGRGGWHFDPCRSSDTYPMNLEIMLHPESIEFIFNEDGTETIDKIIEEQKGEKHI